jgi:hypothetical protein
MNYAQIVNILREAVRRIQQPVIPSKSFVSFGNFITPSRHGLRKCLTVGRANVVKVRVVYFRALCVWFMHERISSNCVHSTCHFVLQYAVVNTACSLIYCLLG